MPTGVAIYSLLKHREECEYDIYVIVGNDVTEDDKDILTRQVKLLSSESKIKFLCVGNSFKESYEVRGVSIATYYRLLIPWLLPELDKVIYSDGDVVFKGSLFKLYDMDLEDNLICGNQKNRWQKKADKRIRSLGLDPLRYTNAGFIVINSKEQRKADLQQVFMSHASKKYFYQDQDILNIVCNGKIKYFSSAYNCGPSAFKGLCCSGKLKYDDIVVIHYAGDKPWKNYCAFWMEWWENYKESIFFDETFYFLVMNKSLSVHEYFKHLYFKFKNKYLSR